MKLCDLCEAIPFDALPKLPAEEAGTLIDDEDMVELMYMGGRASEIQDPFGYAYHENRAALEASAQVCPLCALIHDGVENWHRRLKTKTETSASFREFGLGHYPDPSGQRMWLTSRLNGSPGFLVLTRNPFKGTSNDKMVGLHVLTAVGFSVDDDHPLASQLSVRPMESYSGSQKSIQVASNFLKTCCERQEKCRPVDTQLPSRILDIASSTDDVIRLIDGTGKLGKYASLSYCWGESTPFTTTRETLEARKKGIYISVLPKTMLDAITLSRSLGIPYLWIDGLCICQDDAEEWARESSNMLNIYSQAHLVIAANHASDSSQGIFHDRRLKPFVILDDFPSSPISTTIIENNAQKEEEGGNKAGRQRYDRIHATLLRPLTEWRPDDPRPEEPLPKRGWALQERVLARRSLVYGSDKFFFECSSCCGMVGEDGSGRPAESGPWNPSPSSSSSSEKTTGKKEEEEKALRGWWDRMLWDYGRRKLTRSSDKLPAMSGLARLFQDSMARCRGSGGTKGGEGEEEEYVAGLWSGFMMGGLAWQGIGDRSPASTSSYVGPSWSWASYAGIAAQSGLSPNWQDMAKIEGWNVQLKSKENPFGEVEREGTWLKVRAPVVRMEESDIRTEEMVTHEERLRKVGMTPLPRMRTRYSAEGKNEMTTLDYNEVKESGKWKDMELYALILGGYPKRGEGGEEEEDLYTPSDTYFAIIITPNDIDGNGVEEESAGTGSYGNMKRVGWYFVEEEEVMAMASDESNWSTITLI